MDTTTVSNSIDPNWIMALVTIAAVLAPVFTTLINNIYQAKLKKIEIYEIAKRNALENFIKIATQYIIDDDNHSGDSNYFNKDLFEKYKVAQNSLYIFFRISNDKIYSQCFTGIENCSHDSLHNLITHLSKQIKKK